MARPTRRPRLICCAETRDYRRLARAESLPGDVVLEIGSDLGATCALLARGCGEANVLGVDLSVSSVVAARKAYPAIRFEQFDVLNNAAPNALRLLARAMAPRGSAENVFFTKVFIDVNGNRELSTVTQAACKT